MKKERRSTKRCYPDQAMPLVVNCAKPVVGRIHDISTSGVSIEYTGDIRIDLQQAAHVKLASDLQSSLLVEGIRCRPVYDIPMLAEGQSFRGGPMRLCGFKYDAVSQSKMKKIEQLIASAN